MKKRHMEGPDGYPICGSEIRFPFKGTTYRRENVSCDRCKMMLKKQDGNVSK